jgi:hypothetical protein
MSDDFMFVITAEASPDAFGRIANLFSIANSAPTSARLESYASECLRITVELSGIEARTAVLIHRKILQLTNVLDAELHRSIGPAKWELLHN